MKGGTILINSRSHDTFVVYLVVCAFYSFHKLLNFNLRILASGAGGKEWEKRRLMMIIIVFGKHATAAINFAGALMI